MPSVRRRPARGSSPGRAGGRKRPLGVAHEADGEVDALLAPPAILLDPDGVEHRFELRLQVRGRLGPGSVRVHAADATAAHRGVKWAASPAASRLPGADGRLSHCVSGRLVPMSLSATRTLVLIPAAIALNIVLGSTVQQVLKLPIYLDSLGTVVAGVLAGPLAGLVTGVLTNLIWAYVLPPPLAAPTAGPFAITAAVIGLLAGLWGRLGLFRSRRAAEAPVLLGAVGAAVAVAILVAYTVTRAYSSTDAFKNVTGGGPQALGPSELAFGAVVLVFIGLAAW